jgi:hypothetical protein
MTVLGGFLGDMAVLCSGGVSPFRGQLVGMMTFAGTITDEGGQSRHDSSFSEQGAHPREPRVHAECVQEQRGVGKWIFVSVLPVQKKFKKKSKLR